jgi:hypothetical protein
MVHIGVNRQAALSEHALRFIELLSPKIRKKVVQPTKAR